EALDTPHHSRPRQWRTVRWHQPAGAIGGAASAAGRGESNPSAVALTEKEARMLRKMIRRGVVALGTVLVLVAAAACGAGDETARGADGGGKIRVGVTVYDMSSFITQGQEGMRAYAKANDIELLWNSAGGDVATQANQVDVIGLGVG